MEGAARDERDEGRIHVGVVVGSDEQPVATADDLAAQLQLAPVVVDEEPRILEKSARALRWLSAYRMPFAIGVSSSTRGASASHHAKYFSTRSAAAPDGPSLASRATRP